MINDTTFPFQPASPPRGGPEAAGASPPISGPGGALSDRVTFIVEGVPVGFARAQSNGSQRFTPAKQRAYSMQVKAQAMHAMRGREPFKRGQALIMFVYAVWPAPKSSKADAVTYRTKTPDADNVAKILADAMNCIVYDDDAQIAVLNVSKYEAAKGDERGFVRVSIAPMLESSP